MPDFPTNMESFGRVFAPYYHEHRPIDLIFEFLIVEIIDELPSETAEAISQFVIQFPELLGSSGTDWRLYVRQQLHLSGTFDIAVIDLWHRNLEQAKKDGWEYHPWHYAMNFADEYFKDGSMIDVWPGNALEEAKARIEQWQNS